MPRHRVCRTRWRGTLPQGYTVNLLRKAIQHILNTPVGGLQRLVDRGLIARAPDPSHRQKVIYSLTEPAIQLVPLLAQMGAWGRRHTPVSKELSIRAQLLEEGGPPLWDAFMAELRAIHLGAPAPKRSVLAELQAAFEAVVARGRARVRRPRR